MKPGLRIVDANFGHAHLVACNMRESDRAEILAGWGKEPKAAMVEALLASRFARTAFYGLEALAIYGIADMHILGGSGEIWCFGTTAVDNHRLAFARGSRRVVGELLASVPILTNLVDIGDERALRWLAFLGARYVLQPQARGGKLFQQFILARGSPPMSRKCQQG